jgi:hypothetical protein
MGGHKPTPSEEAPQMANPMDFVTPSQFVELPSGGNYHENHPLHGQGTIEIKYMTAKDEDILTNRSLLKKGLAIDRLIQNLILNKGINARSLLIGDRNAILINARASAYGADYKTKIACPGCGETSKFEFDLAEHQIHAGEIEEGTNIKSLGDGTYVVTLPLSTVQARFRLLTGQDEIDLISDKKSVEKDLVTRQMKSYIIDFNGYEDRKTIHYVVDNMVATDSRYLRDCVRMVTPDISMNQEFSCKHCEHKEVVAVPFGTEFFWPDR